jgi:RES domain-containing protein
MIVYRITRQKYTNDLSGKGAEKTGGRWNSKGTTMLYCSNSIAHACMEVVVNLPSGNPPPRYVLIIIEIPDTIKVSVLQIKDLPKKWNIYPHPEQTQKMGDKFIKENKHLILQVPSASVQGDVNFLINPNHPDFKKIKIKKVEPFGFDDRLFKQK